MAALKQSMKKTCPTVQDGREKNYKKSKKLARKTRERRTEKGRPEK